MPKDMIKDKASLFTSQHRLLVTGGFAHVQLEDWKQS